MIYITFILFKSDLVIFNYNSNDESLKIKNNQTHIKNYLKKRIQIIQSNHKKNLKITEKL